MPIQEALVTAAAGLAAPCGVSFNTPGDKFGTKAADMASWAAACDAIVGELQKGSVVIALIQTRNYREWSPQLKQFRFDPAEDYLVSGWSVNKRLGSPYRPGTVLERWYGDVDARLGPTGDAEGIVRFWDCDPMSCKLSRQGPGIFIAKMCRVKPEAEVIAMTKKDHANNQKYGWRGGTFPGGQWASRPTTQRHPSIRLGNQGAPTYQAPTPPMRRN